MYLVLRKTVAYGCNNAKGGTFKANIVPTRHILHFKIKRGKNNRSLKNKNKLFTKITLDKLSWAQIHYK